MLKEFQGFTKVYIACGYTDLRYGIDGLAAAVQNQFHLDPFDQGTLFLFCGRKSDRIKGLLWEGDGFLLLYKRIDDGRFQWPRKAADLRTITHLQYEHLLEGLNIESTIREVHPTRAV
ncbi:MAG: IS66 family insertion sequence element accessory protein TnpB [Solobacterium sp.]|jgi:transposase|nr:IS66 family insertion sequence element accessory protein TnpB [Solobacterium sp.]MCH3961772.1 IS66 family insertion sequence element accessory protein TnpB [Solobacterium sp.]